MSICCSIAFISSLFSFAVRHMLLDWLMYVMLWKRSAFSALSSAEDSRQFISCCNLCLFLQFFNFFQAGLSFSSFPSAVLHLLSCILPNTLFKRGWLFSRTFRTFKYYRGLYQIPGYSRPGKHGFKFKDFPRSAPTLLQYTMQPGYNTHMCGVTKLFLSLNSTVY